MIPNISLLKTHKWITVTVIGGLIAAIGILVWLLYLAPVDGAEAGNWVHPVRAGTSQPIVLNGHLEPVTTVNISTPFDGKVLRKSVQVGDLVAQNQVLLEIGSDNLHTERRDGQAAAIRSLQALNAAKSWASSSEVMVAQRQLSLSDAGLQSSLRSLAEIQTLYDKGIVSRNELDGAHNSVEQARAQKVNAAESLANIVEKGNASNIRLLELEHLNRLAKEQEINQKIGQAQIKAPIAGVVLAPSQSYSDSGMGKDLDEGSVVTQKGTLLSIGDTSAYAVRGAIDEIDIQRVKPGMPVKIIVSIDQSLILAGELTRVSSQARRADFQSDSSVRAAIFDIVAIARNIPAEVKKTLRIGTSVRMEIEPEAGATGVLIPLASVAFSADGSAKVRRRLPKGGHEWVSPKLGATSTDQVEVLQGLTTADEIWVPELGSTANRAGDQSANPLFGLPSD